MFSAQLSEPVLTATPGGVVGCDLRLRNPGDAALTVRVEPRGKAGAWAVVRPSKVAVAADGEAEARLTFTVPDVALAAGEIVDFTIRVVGDQAFEVPGQIEIVERRDVRLSVHPLMTRDRRLGRHTVVVANRGNVAAQVLLTARSEGGRATVRLASPSESVSVAPGEQASVELAATALRRWFGRRARSHRIVVTGDRADGPQLEAAAMFFQDPVRGRAVAAMAIGAAAVLASAGFLLARLGPGLPPPPPVPAAGVVAADTAVPSNCPVTGDGSLVPIAVFAYCPGTVTIGAGTEVRWRNDDLAPHTATSDAGDFETGVLAQGQSASVRFDRPGTFSYFCRLHPAMRGIVVVTA